MTSKEGGVAPLVLVADDDEQMRCMLSDTLSRSGFEVLAAEDGKIAWDWFNRRRPPDLVLLDVDLAGIDAFELAPLVRHTAHGTHLPVLLLAAMDNLETVSRAYEAGATDLSPSRSAGPPCRGASILC